MGTAQALAEALMLNRALTRLDLGGCQFGGPGTEAPADLGTLEFKGGCFTGCAVPVPWRVQALAELLKVNTVLTSMDIGSCHIAGAGTQASLQFLSARVGRVGLLRHHCESYVFSVIS